MIRQLGPDVVIGLVTTVDQVLAPSSVILQFAPQIFGSRRLHYEPGALSLVSLALQVAALLAVAVSWLLRLGTPAWGSQYISPSLWYGLGLLPINYAIYVIGNAILLGLFLLAPCRGTSEVLQEAAPLLA